MSQRFVYGIANNACLSKPACAKGAPRRTAGGLTTWANVKSKSSPEGLFTQT